MQYLINEYIQRYPKARANYDMLLNSQPSGNTYDIPKKSLHVLLNEGVS